MHENTKRVFNRPLVQNPDAIVTLKKYPSKRELRRAFLASEIEASVRKRLGPMVSIKG